MRDIQLEKMQRRIDAAKVRDAFDNRTMASEAIVEKLKREQAFQSASAICCYVSFRSEVATHRLLNEIFNLGKRIAVPKCEKDDLRLFWIESFDDLSSGTFGILEPRIDVRTFIQNHARLTNCQLVIVPGLAFTKEGARLGYGRGYYDRLLSSSPATKRVALAFDCQVVEETPMTPNDEYMDIVLTESNRYWVPRKSMAE